MFKFEDSEKSNSGLKQINMMEVFQPWSKLANSNKQIKSSSQPWMKFIQNIIQIDESSKNKFQQLFLYGKTLSLYRNQKLKKVQLYIDRNYQSLIWISTKTKAFVIDMCFTALQLVNSQLSKKFKNYFTFCSFGQTFTFIFEENQIQQMKNLIKITDKYIKWCKLKNNYSAFYSRILRLYAIQSTRSNLFNAKQVLQITKKLNFKSDSISEEILLECLNKQTKKSDNKINMKTIIERKVLDDYLKILICSPSLTQIFEKYAKKKIQKHINKLQPMMTKENFKNFLTKQQEQNQNISNILDTIPQNISMFDFCTYIQSSTLNYASKTQKLDESHPLNHYFCFSSHNTYLTGNQLWSQSSIQRYTQDLMNGIKCVQIDVHNNGQQLVVTHAVKDRSLTSKISFQGVIKAIDQFTDEYKNHYPIILSIQNHAKQQNKEKMLNLLTNILNKKIFYYDPSIKQFPPLSYLKQKIIIKTNSQIKEVKQLKSQEREIIQLQTHNYLLGNTFKTQSQFEDEQFQKKYTKFNKTVIEYKIKKSTFNAQIENMKMFFLPLSSMTKVTSMFKAPHGVLKQIKPQSLTPFQCVSLVNSKVLTYPLEEMVNCTKKIWVRTYPHGLEMSSNNYDPCEMLNVGAQIIALNTQTKDQYAFLMKAFFRSGKSLDPSHLGYVLKPPYLRGQSKKPTIKMRVYVQIVEKYNYSLSMSFYGLEKQMQLNKNSNGVFITQNPDVSFLLVEIDQNNYDCIPLRYIRKGYRVIVLRNDDFIDSSIRIIVRIDIQSKQI